MDDLDLFQAALGLRAPWRVAKTEFKPSDRSLNIWIDFEKGGHFPCPECGELGPAYDTKNVTWRHLDFFQYKTFLQARTPRVECATHGVLRVEVPWARPGSGFTFLFEAMIVAMAPHAPVNALARQARERDKRLWRILNHHVEEARSRADHSQVCKVGMDETSRRKGHQYVSIFMELGDKPRVLFATPGKDETTVERFAQDIKAHGGDPARIEEASLDMSPAYANGVAAHLPNARITYDRFHTTKLLHTAVDEVRRQEQKTQKGLKKTRYLWLKRGDRLKPMDQQRVAGLVHAYPQTGLAYQLKESFRDLYDEDPTTAPAYLEEWCTQAESSGLEPIQKFVQTVRDHWDGVLRWFRSRITNGILEGINSLIQAAKAKARGYRSERNLLTMVYLLAGRLDYRFTHSP